MVIYTLYGGTLCPEIPSVDAIKFNDLPFVNSFVTFMIKGIECVGYRFTRFRQ